MICSDRRQAVGFALGILQVAHVVYIKLKTANKPAGTVFGRQGPEVQILSPRPKPQHSRTAPEAGRCGRPARSAPRGRWPCRHPDRAPNSGSRPGDRFFHPTRSLSPCPPWTAGFSAPAASLRLMIRRETRPERSGSSRPAPRTPPRPAVHAAPGRPDLDCGRRPACCRVRTDVRPGPPWSRDSARCARWTERRARPVRRRLRPPFRVAQPCPGCW